MGDPPPLQRQGCVPQGVGSWRGELTAEKVDVRGRTPSPDDTTHSVADDDDDDGNRHCNLMMIIWGSEKAIKRPY